MHVLTILYYKKGLLKQLEIHQLYKDFYIIEICLLRAWKSFKKLMSDPKEYERNLMCLHRDSIRNK